MQTFSFSTLEGNSKSTLVDMSLTNPEQYTARLFATPMGGSELIVFDGIGGITSRGVTIVVPASLAQRSYSPVALRLEMSKNSEPYATAATGRMWVTEDEGFGASVDVTNMPSVFPLPDSQLTAIVNSGGGGGSTGGLTNTELRASPVPVGGSVALDAPTLAALETITVAIQNGQLVGLDATTLAALETIIVSGTVALDSNTLAALENITATISGPVALDTATLNALESITATISGNVNIGNFPATQTVAGTVSLSPGTLAELESITVAIQSGQLVGLDSTTLTALENIVVSGTVALDTATLTALENINAVVSGTVDVGNFPASQTVSGTVALDTSTLNALENITATVSGAVSVSNFPATQTVAGTVALDTATLSALENITVAIANGQIVGLDSASLAALENIVISGTVAMDSASLAALENITATISGPVALDSATLTALENITAVVSGTVNIGNFPDLLTDTQLRASALPVVDSASLIKVPYDRIDITVYTANNDPQTILYKQGSTTVATLTLTYDGSNRITSVVKT